MADSRKLVLILPILLVYSIGLCNAEEVITEPKEVKIVEEEPVSIKCMAPERKSLVYCRFEIPGMAAVRVSRNMQNINGISWYGNEDLEDGACGITIDRVKEYNHGVVRCTLGVKDSDIELVGAIDFEVYVAPTHVEIVDDTRQAHNDLRDLKEQDILVKTCIVRGGRPDPNIKLFLGDQQISDSEIINEAQVMVTVGGQGNQTQFQRTLKNHMISQNDFGKSFKCVVEHPAYPDSTKTLEVPLNIKFRPQAQISPIVAYGAKYNERTVVSVTIHANPEPKRVIWKVDSQPIDIHSDKYHGSVVYSGIPDFYNVTLEIEKLTVEDTQKTYDLHVENEMGHQDYVVKISSTGEPMESSPLDIGTIVSVAVIGIIVVLLIALLLVARATGRWCFAGASLNTDIGQDFEAQIPNTNDEIDEKTHEHYHPDDHTNEQSADEKQKELNGKHENGKDHKTNTSV